MSIQAGILKGITTGLVCQNHSRTFRNLDKNLPGICCSLLIFLAYSLLGKHVSISRCDNCSWPFSYCWDVFQLKNRDVAVAETINAIS